MEENMNSSLRELSDKIDGVRETAAQQTESNNAVAEGLRQSVETILRELRYISQQNSSIYDSVQDDNAALKAAVVEAVNHRTDEMADYVERKISEQFAALRKELLTTLNTANLEARLAKRFEIQTGKVMECVEDVEDRVAENIEKFERKYQEGLTALREELLESVNQVGLACEANASARSVSELRDEVLDALNAGFVAVEDRLDGMGKPESLDYDLLAEKIVELLEAKKKAAEEAAAAEAAEAEAEGPVEEVSEEPETKPVEDLIDYDLLADKIAMSIPEFDYDLLADKVAAAIPQAEFDYDAVADKVAASVPVTDENVVADKVLELLPALDYELIAEGVASVLEKEFDLSIDEAGVSAIAEKVAEAVEEKRKAAEEAEEEEGPEEPEETDVFDCDEFAEKIAALVDVEPQPIDYDAIAGKVADLIEENRKAAEEEAAAKAAEEAAEEEPVEEEPVEIKLDYDVLAEKVAELVDEKRRLSEEEAAVKAAEEAAANPVPEKDEIDYDELAGKVASLIVIDKEEPDYDELAKKVVEVIDEKCAACRAEEEPAPAIDYDELAKKVVEVIDEKCAACCAEEEPAPAIDYDEIAEKVVALLEEKGLVVAAPAEEEPVEEPAPAEEEPVEEPAPAEEEPVEEPAPAEEEPVEEPAPVEEEPVEEPAPVEEEPAEEPAPVEEEPAEEPAPVEEEPAEEPAPVEEEPAEEPAPVEEEPVEEPVPVEEVPAEEPASVEEELAIAAEPAVAEPVPEDNLTTRYKRSFTAKIIESEEVIKEYYSVLKNEMLSYTHMSSQVNWANDRFAYNNETVAKIGVRGKTLCVYLALNPEEFPETVYHQKFAGDTKMYEKTPLMMKVKSRVALKRSLRLIELLMERLGAVKEEIETVDYAAMYAFRSEEELLEEGLIKTAIVEKSNLDF